MELRWAFREQEPVLQYRVSSYSPWTDVPQSIDELPPKEAAPAAPTRTDRVCKRSACRTNRSDTWWWNQSTLGWYCRTCAHGINNKESGGTPYLCVPDYNLPLKEDL